MIFYEKLQKLRKEKGLSQEALAEMLDVSRQAVSKWESGAAFPEMEKLIAISEIFGVTIDSLVKDGELRRDEQNTASKPYWTWRERDYEYKSKRTLFGLPLVHINTGRGIKRAKGIIAIGNVATGFISIGLLSVGLLSFGALSAGLIGFGALCIGLVLAVGAISVGFFAAGAIAVGVIALGALSIGVYSIGACAIASRVAIGDYAYGHIAAGRVIQGVKVFFDVNLHYPEVSAAFGNSIYSEFPGTWEWIANLLKWFANVYYG